MFILFVKVAVMVLSFSHQHLMPKILRCDLEAIKSIMSSLESDPTSAHSLGKFGCTLLRGQDHNFSPIFWIRTYIYIWGGKIMNCNEKLWYFGVEHFLCWCDSISCDTGCEELVRVILCELMLLFNVDLTVEVVKNIRAKKYNKCYRKVSYFKCCLSVEVVQSPYGRRVWRKNIFHLTMT